MKNTHAYQCPSWFSTRKHIRDRSAIPSYWVRQAQHKYAGNVKTLADNSERKQTKTKTIPGTVDSKIQNKNESETNKMEGKRIKKTKRKENRSSEERDETNKYIRRARPLIDTRRKYNEGLGIGMIKISFSNCQNPKR